MPGTWEESKHPRARNGEFGQGDGTGGRASGASGARRDAATRLVQAGARRRLRPPKPVEPAAPPHVAGPSAGDAAKLSSDAHAASEKANKSSGSSWQADHTAAADAHAMAMEAHPMGSDEWRAHSKAMGDHLAKSTKKPPAASISGTGDASKAAHHIKESLRQMRMYNQAVRDGDSSKALEHLVAARQHAVEVDRHTPLDHASRAGASGPSKFARGTPEFEAHARPLAKSDGAHIEESEGRVAPEHGGLKAADYDDMADRYAASLTPDQKFAVKNYSDHTDRVLNPMLRSTKGAPDESADLYGGEHADKKVKRDQRQGGDGTVGSEIRALDSAIAAHKMDRDAVVYRTMSDPGGKIAGSLTPGATFVDHGYMSTTADRNFLTDFYDNSGLSISGRANQRQDRVDFHIQLRKGDTAAPIGKAAAEFVPDGMPTKEGETELLMPRGSRLRVTKVVEASGTQPKQIHLEVVRDDKTDDARRR